jgi:hypothetical protein
MSAISAGFGPFLAIHNFIDQQKIPPSSKRLWGALYGFYHENGIVYVCRAVFAEKLNVSKRTISQGLNVLKKLGFIKFTGEFKFGFYPCFELVHPDEDNGTIKSADSPPVNKRSAVAEHLLTEQGTFVHTKQKKEEPIKEQTTTVVFPEKEFSSNEKIALKQKLKAIGVHKRVIERLTTKHSMEKINAQIEHLQYVTERGGSIERPAAWLISAIEKDYPLPKETNKNSLEEERKTDAVLKATVTAQRAKDELMAGNLKEALELSAKSTLMAENQLAKEVHREAVQIIDRAEKIEKARQMISPEQLRLIRQEEEQKKFKEMQRWYKNDNQIRESTLFKGAVEALVNQRLLAAV